VLDDRSPEDLILLVTGRISGELAFKAARARIAVVATPSIPSTIAVDIAKAARMVLIGRAVSGHPQLHRESGIGNRESGGQGQREPGTGNREPESP
jgi:formate dehydrogenase assembly factor FdhD